MRTILFLLLLLSNCGVFAQSGSSSAKTEHLDVALISENAAIVPAQEFWVGLDFHMQPGWHVYWVNPGDSGQPPTVKWNVPKGFAVGDIQWPKPERISLSTLVDYGYSDHVLFMLPMHAAQDAKGSALLQADVHWLVCREICIPGKAQLELTLPIAAKAKTDPAAHQAFEAARAQIPQPAPSDWKATTAVGKDDFILKVETGARERAAQFFPLQELQIDNAAAQQVTPAAKGIELRLKKSEGLSNTPGTLQGLLVLASGKAVIIDAPVNGIAAASPVSGSRSLLGFLGLAFLGGLILNLMPCVLPVLSLKVLGLAQLRPEQRREARVHGLWYTVGILVSFWVIVAALLAIRAAGRQIGWGFQLQSPVFVVCMTVLMFLLALNLMGVFEVGTSVMGIGSELTEKKGYTGSFFTGVLATVVATPCVAPFMGAAIGFALTQSWLVCFLVFTFLALGLAAPYLLFSLEPRWAHLLPKPGMWMVRLKQALAFPLFATSLWLVWVFGQQLGMDAAARLLAGLLLTAISAWIYGVFSARVVRDILAIIVLAVGLYIPISVSGAAKPVSAASPSPTPANELIWETFSPEKLTAYRAQGKPVLVDFTAAWCLSCQVNERAILHSDEVVQRLKQSGVVLMKADWTSYDPSITKALADYGRSGVPFYVLYGRGPDPILSTEFITPQAVLGALNKL